MAFIECLMYIWVRGRAWQWREMDTGNGFGSKQVLDRLRCDSGAVVHGGGFMGSCQNMREQKEKK